MTEDRDRALASALGTINQQFGRGSIMRMGQCRSDIPSIPTGSLGLDHALGVGGLPRGRVCEFYGPESSGKTTVALHAIAEAQKQGGIAALVDAEGVLDPVYAAAVGVDLDALLVARPDDAEQALEVADTLVSSGAVDLVVVDSVTALTPRGTDPAAGDRAVEQARLMSQALRKMTAALHRSRTCCVFINQSNRGTTPGGRALRFYASVRLDVGRVGMLREGSDYVGNRVRVTVVKNKLAPPLRQTEFDVLFGHGISREGSLIDLGVAHGVIRRTGAGYTFDGRVLGQQREDVRAHLREHTDTALAVEMLTTRRMGLTPSSVPVHAPLLTGVTR